MSLVTSELQNNKNSLSGLHDACMTLASRSSPCSSTGLSRPLRPHSNPFPTPTRCRGAINIIPGCSKGRGHSCGDVGLGELDLVSRKVSHSHPSRRCLATALHINKEPLRGYEEAIRLLIILVPFSDYASRLITGYMADANLGRKGSCHLLQHTYATQMFENGADIRYIQQLLGHMNLDTISIYTQVSVQQLQKVHTMTHPAEKQT